MASTSFSTGGGSGSNGLGTPTAATYAPTGQVSFGTGDPAAFSSQQQQLQNAYGWTPEQYASWAANPINASQVVSDNNWAATQAAASPSQSVATKPATAEGGLAGAIGGASSGGSSVAGLGSGSMASGFAASGGTAGSGTISLCRGAGSSPLTPADHGQKRCSVGVHVGRHIRPS